MTFEELLIEIPALQKYVKHMPEDIRHRFTLRTLPPGSIIHQKDSVLESFGIVCRGEHRVINEFENGNIFMIEKNEAISFIGEVTVLACQERTSVTIETTSECLILFISLEDFKYWIENDIHFLRMISEKIAAKLYRSSYNRGTRLFYSSHYLLLKYTLDRAKENGIEENNSFTLKKTREEIHEELGMTVKTLNRTIAKLKQDGLIELEKGKIKLTRQQYNDLIKNVQSHLQQGKRGGS